MKLLIVSPRLCHGGAERVAVTLANGFIHRGHDVVFLTDLFEEQTYQLDDAVQVKSLVAVSTPKYKKWFSAIRIVRKNIRKEKPNVMIGIMSLCSIIAWIASRGLHVPVVATEHNSYERPQGVKFSLYDRIYKFHLSKLFDVVTVLTGADKQLLRNKDNVVVTPNPLILKPVEDIPKKENVVLAAGRVDNWHYKGFDVLIKAFSKLVQSSKFKVQNEGWKLQIAGVWRNPETRKYLDGIAEECGVLDKIEYLGFVEDMKSLYQKASIFVLSSRYEGFGLVLIEAMSQGCACIACDYKGRQKEILRSLTPNPSPKGEGELPTEGSGAAEPETRNSKIETRNSETETRNSHVELCETGILCEPDDVDALAEAMKTMIMEDDYRESIRHNAIERSKFYSIENTMDRWESLLNNIV